MNRRMNGVHVNEVQGNPFQTDVNYRGYTASPLLGTPQGLSIYMDGVRLNQPFGDVVSWDLIPQNGDFLEHPDAWLQPDLRAQHARRRAVASDERRTQQRGHVCRSHLRRRRQAIHRIRTRRQPRVWTCTGLRRGISSRRTAGARTPRRTFGSCSAKSDGCTPVVTSSLTLAYADNSMTGNGLQDLRFLDQDFASVYTKPDETNNHAVFVKPSPSVSTLNGHAAADRQRVLPRHSHRYAERRSERGLARSVHLSADTRGAERRLRRRATPGFRRAAPTRRTHRSRSGDASRNVLLATNPPRSAMASSTAPTSSAQRRGVRTADETRRHWRSRESADRGRRPTTGARVGVRASQRSSDTSSRIAA